ncbi:MAG: apolipoprotein N-acyltransferase, partial [Verrucomicrobia bacterium]|nr:apolipoprotein N-acyltransferase [Verrucomicrobiota bacterium]
IAADRPPRARWKRGRAPALAVLAGILWALSFPLPGWSGLAWIAPGLLLAIGFHRSPGSAFRLGALAGLAHHLIALRWLLHIPFPSGAVAGWLALGAYCALFSGLWLALAGRLLQRWARLPPGSEWTPAVLAVTRLSEWRRQGLWLLVAALWVALELVRCRFLGGFPWNLFGITQWRNLPLLQIASVTGVYGLSFVLCWISAALAGALAVLVFRSEHRLAWTAALRFPVLVLLILLGLGFRRVVHSRPPDAVATLALVQPSIPQRLIWDDAANPARFEKVLGLTREAIAARPDAIIWPEGSMPDLTADQFTQVTGLLQGTAISWIFGTAYGQEVAGRPEHYNAAVLVHPQGRVVERYHKQRLVIFGEFIPFEDTLPFMRWLTPIGSSFTPGRGPARFVFGSGPVVASPMICFEDVFPHHTRSHATPETDFLLELTNNGWFGESSAQWQHTASAVLRAVENGLPLVRCANNGLTCWVDGQGGLHDLLRSGSGSVYAAGVDVVRVPLRPGGLPRPLTPYHRHGDVFAWACTALALLGIAAPTGLRTLPAEL